MSVACGMTPDIMFFPLKNEMDSDKFTGFYHSLQTVKAKEHESLLSETSEYRLALVV